MLACIAEGRSHADDEEATHRKGVELRCELSLVDIDQNVAAHKAKEVSADAANPTMIRINAASSLAVHLAESMAQISHQSSSHSNSLHKRCRRQGQSAARTESEGPALPTSAALHLESHDWRAAYATWREKTFNPRDSTKAVPNE